MREKVGTGFAQKALRQQKDREQNAILANRILL
jgi:hypothetical protein